MTYLEKCSVLKDIRKPRSYSETSYDSLSTKVALSKRVSSESGYGTTTTWSSVSSGYKCRHLSDICQTFVKHLSDNDDVFYSEEEEEEVGDQTVTDDKEPT